MLRKLLLTGLIGLWQFEERIFYLSRRAAGIPPEWCFVSPKFSELFYPGRQAAAHVMLSLTEVQ